MSNAPNETATTPMRALATQELGLLKQLAETRAEADAAEIAAGIGYLDNTDGDHLDESVRLRARERGLNHAISALRVRRRELLQQMLDAEIAQFRDRATTLRADAQAIAGQAAPLLDQLASIQETDYAPRAMTKSDRILTLVGHTERKADDLERAGILASGCFQPDLGAFTEEEIVRGVLETPTICPAASEIFDWLRTRKDSALFSQHRIEVIIRWSDGKITSDSKIGVWDPLVPVAPQPEAPPAVGRKLSYNQLMGHEARPTYAQHAEKTS